MEYLAKEGILTKFEAEKSVRFGPFATMNASCEQLLVDAVHADDEIK